MEKKVPDNIIWGNPNRLIRSGIEVSVFTMLLKISPTPINRKSIIIDVTSISRKVRNP